MAWRQASQKGGIRRAAEALADQLAHALGRERPGAQALGRGIPDQFGQKRGIRARLARAQRDREQDRRALEPPGQIGEKAQGGRVAPVHVVHGQQQRTLRGQVEGQPVQAVQGGEGVVTRALAGGLHLPEHGPGAAGRSLEHRPVAVGLCHGPLQELTHDAERELPLQLAAAGRQDPQRALGGAAQPRQQAALADPGRPLDDQQPAAAAPGGIDQRVQRRELALALE